jgi:hypothetical protein
MKYVTTLTPGSGIGSIVIGIINALAYLKSNNIDEFLFINMNKVSYPGNVLFTCFLDIEKIESVKMIDIPINVKWSHDLNKYQVTTPGDYLELWYTPVVKSSDFLVKCQVLNSFWILKETVIRQIALETQHYSNTDLCINIRRGDKITLEPHAKQGSIEEYGNAVNRLKDIKSIFHTSDDYDTFLEFKDKYPDWNIATFCTPKDNGYFLKDLNECHVPENVVNHVFKFLKELEMMKKSKWFIGTTTTNVGLLVELFRVKQNIIFIY